MNNDVKTADENYKMRYNADGGLFKDIDKVINTVTIRKKKSPGASKKRKPGPPPSDSPQRVIINYESEI